MTVDFSEGGIAPGPRGNEVKAILEMGERVLRIEETFCVEDGCRNLSTTSRPVGMAGDTPVVELVCDEHKDTDE